MRKLITFLLAAFLVFPITAQQLSISEGLAYVPVASYAPNDDPRVSDPSFGSKTNVEFDSKYLDAKLDVLIASNYRSVFAFVKPNYDLTDHLSLISELSYEYSLITSEYNSAVHPMFRDKFTYKNISEHDVNLSVGLELHESLWDVVSIDLSALVGYVPVYKDFKDLCTTKFQINAGIYKYIDVYFAIESFQQFASFAQFDPLFVKNSYGINVHYSFNKHFTVFADWQHYCAHPERAWNNIPHFVIYNKSFSQATIGVKYTF